MENAAGRPNRRESDGKGREERLSPRRTPRRTPRQTSLHFNLVCKSELSSSPVRHIFSDPFSHGSFCHRQAVFIPAQPSPFLKEEAT